jgi:hypothetical protein
MGFLGGFEGNCGGPNLAFFTLILASIDCNGGSSWLSAGKSWVDARFLIFV